VRPREGGASPRTPAQLQHLVSESRRLGLIEDDDHGVLTRALDAPTASIEALVVETDDIVGVPADASPQDVIDVSAHTGHTRLLVWDEENPRGVLHVRDAYLARSRGAATTARRLAHPVPTVSPDTVISEAVTAMRTAHSQIALVRNSNGALRGLVTLDDLLAKLLVQA
ncbi:CBS domain-containing protein, partial [Nonomuraea sp. NPDC059007]|uniref:CBS domain-containing protein n=1 Tax=Nonomuraea sp. NPDC059007 TaxID=3346692 RepID=UPI0036B62D2B